ncbi:hypothetical protein PGIGA_G00127200 [Pangasianodon gigas]|uniref:Uncharacterized protein n=1 Tax=Pangasianodon gigas TaxID=30993 RepID=A0ACC5XIR0_PANGG|nr:hypothetical protein [Pangasianodon gigas]
MEWADESGIPSWPASEREFSVDQQGNVCRNTGHMTDYLSDDTEKAPSLQAHTLREFEQHLNDLKKENFSLKLRIYFLEERIQQKYENNSDDVYRTNIELKVEVESLKQELQEKQQLLDKALTTAESLTNNNEAELQRRCEARQQEIDHMQQVLQTKIQLLQEEAQLARSEAERMASLAESCSKHPPVTMEPITKEMSVAKSSQPPNLLPDNRDSKRIEELTAAVRCKEMLIRELTEERSSLRERVTEMEEQLQELSTSLLQKERDAEFYQEELGRERLRVQQEMQVRLTGFGSVNVYLCFIINQFVAELQWWTNHKFISYVRLVPIAVLDYITQQPLHSTCSRHTQSHMITST